MLTPREILEELKQVRYPGYTRDIVSFGIVQNVEIATAGITVTLSRAGTKPEVIDEIRAAVKQKVEATDSGIRGVCRAGLGRRVVSVMSNTPFVRAIRPFMPAIPSSTRGVGARGCGPDRPLDRPVTSGSRRTGENCVDFRRTAPLASRA